MNALYAQNLISELGRKAHILKSYNIRLEDPLQQQSTVKTHKQTKIKDSRAPKRQMVHPVIWTGSNVYYIGQSIVKPRYARGVLKWFNDVISVWSTVSLVIVCFDCSWLDVLSVKTST
jgi:hypothetical protein